MESYNAFLKTLTINIKSLILMKTLTLILMINESIIHNINENIAIHTNDENEDDDDDEAFLINSSSRIYIELNDMELPSVQAPSFSTLAAQNSSPVQLLTGSSLSLQQVITPSTAASVIYNKLLTEETHPSLSMPKKSSSCIRQQRKFSEIVTSDEFLEEIKRRRKRSASKQKLHSNVKTKK
ncbi:unnamed protein product [Rotaria socialis]|uniref:Uncharacterized protein n=1 Tax=Rotaria socialis TaxID=392032 RepID=A0A817T548_9BILA|nr:unnamed protein product [Rotaria socialis]